MPDVAQHTLHAADSSGHWPITACHEGLKTTDSVEKVGFSARLNSGTTTTGEPIHHIEWFFGPSLSFAARLVG
ncbi:hypothetical protein, partial [Pseudomonas sp. GL-R-19]|uniref:hypothetical protein n=1 Tax=Pseudomonas sp. GL-R-19 TaxID=2832391 RepID=UPI001CBD24E3